MANNVLKIQGCKEGLLPNTIPHKVSACEHASTEGPWNVVNCGGCFEDRFLDGREPGSKTTFAW